MSAPDALHPAVFLDRDGTIMHDVAYCSDPAQVRVFDDAHDALTRLRNAGFKLFVITNQSGIGRGYFNEDAYHAVAAKFERQLGDGMIDGTYFCPDAPDAASDRRKPAPGMIFEAQRDHALDLSRSYFIGDKQIDAECGRNAGVRTILVESGCEEHDPAAHDADWLAPNLSAAADIILRDAR
jgi:D-glycero-D-manno-heptose 1,7-bisphosphate phosphatase